MTVHSDWRAEARAMVAGLPPMPEALAEAMTRVPRHLFVPERYRSSAYADEPLPLPYGDATISAPHMVALQLEFAEPRAGLRILEVGVGFGYLAALLADLTGPSGHVFGIDIESGLVREARRRLGQAGLGERVTLRAGDGVAGWPESAPFDRILVSCATPELYDAWRRQLAPHGTLVAPVGSAWSQELVRYRAGSPKDVLDRGPRCRFVPLRGRLHPDI
ncbi:MAG TPA: protein-L-isoaspartate O-methyltransferase [Thermoplasmata archaeon]|nr:protein-L-isoaspartate O-methyltransferase [Thermoplasmata archaeon]